MRIPVSSALRRLLACSVAGLAMLVSAAPSFAAYPEHQIRIVVPFAAGGATDLIARAYAEELTRTLKQPAFVDNRPGAGARLGSQFVARSAPDGYTLLVTNTALVQAFLLPGEQLYEMKDFAPVCELTLSPIAFAVPSSLGVSSLEQFVDKVRASPGKYAFGSAGVGQTVHFYGELLRQKAGIDLPHVPYKGEAPFLTDLVAGHVASGFATVASMRPFLESGQLKALAVPGTERSPLLPKVPTLRELGYNGFEPVGWFGLLAPAGTPRAVIDQLNAAANSMLKQPEMQRKLNELALTPVGGTPEDFERVVTHDPAAWAEVVKSAKIKLD
jgi:tripartite-type tricarboxylate transporter receptor subunit TctC